MIHFEDLEVGQRASFGSCHVTREEVIAFASRLRHAAAPLVWPGGGQGAFRAHRRQRMAHLHDAMAMIARNLVDTEQPGFGSEGTEYMSKEGHVMLLRFNV